jgi:hypothetical protein
MFNINLLKCNDKRESMEVYIGAGTAGKLDYHGTGLVNK